MRFIIYLKSKFFLSEDLSKTYKCDINLLEKENSDLRTKLIEAENTHSAFESESKAKFDRELNTYRHKYHEFELKYKDKLDLSEKLESSLNQKTRLLSEVEMRLTSSESKLVNLFNEHNRLNQVCSESSAEILDLQRKLCSVLMEKDKLSKDLAESIKRYDTDMKKQEEYQVNKTELVLTFYLFI